MHLLHIYIYIYKYSSLLLCSVVYIISFIKKMKERRTDRSVILFPFSAGCISQSSIAVCETRPQRRGEKDEEAPSRSIFPSGEYERKSSTITTLRRPSISLGLQKVVKSFKSLSELFLLDDQMEYDDEEGERQMEIGFPTDVKHITHIGWDGFNI